MFAPLIVMNHILKKEMQRVYLNLRNSMAVASLLKVEKYKISRRTIKIIGFIKNRL